MSPKFESYVEITDYYRSQLREADLMISARQLDVAKFTDAFNAYHGSTLEALAPAFEKMASPDAWVLEMARKHTQAKHPLQHVLFQMFLDACPRREPPFGRGRGRVRTRSRTTVGTRSRSPRWRSIGRATV
jgi:hypothetical protein